MQKDLNYLVRCRESLFLSVFFIAASLAQAQVDTLKYNGPFKLNEREGTASYQYVLKKEDTLKVGLFRFRESEKSTSDSLQKYTYVIEGGFNSGTPTGSWSSTENRYRASSSSQKIVNHQYVTELDGIQVSTSLILRNGKANGSWKVVKDSIQDSNVQQNLFRSEISFQDGIPQKSFSITSGPWSMAGRLLRDGLAHDEWTLFSSDGVGEVESWIFENGLLRKIQVADPDGMTSNLRFYNSTYKKSKTISLDRHFIDILELLQTGRDSSHVYSLGIAELLNKNLEYFRETNAYLTALGGTNAMEHMRVRVPFYPIPPASQTQLDSIASIFDRAQDIDQALLQDTQLNILKLSDEETDFLYRAAEQIKVDYLNPLGKLVNYHRKDLLQHVDTAQVLKNLWSEGLPPAQIQVSHEDTLRELEPAHKTAYDSGDPINFTTVRELANFTLDRLELLRQKLDLKVSNTKKATQVLEQENKLIEASRQLRTTLEGFPDDLPEEVQAAINGISRYMDTRLEDYSNLPDTAEKVNYAGDLIVCFGELGDLAATISKLPQQMDEIDQVYTDEVWNPFTATLMDEKVKKRLTKAYNDQVIPFVLNKVETGLDCSNASAYNKLFDQLNKRMFALREKETRRLERKVKRRDDAREILQLLEITATPWNKTK